jgi:hypothetical protein
MSDFTNQMCSEEFVKNSVAFLLVLMVLPLPAASAADRSSRWRAVWRASQAMLVAGNVADIASSWGKYETNPLLYTGPRFGFGSMAVKLAIVSGDLAVQQYVQHKSPNKIPYFVSANFAIAGVLSIVAVHNAGVPAAASR